MTNLTNNPDKARVAFERFVDSGYDESKLTDTLYRALSLSFGFIAHHDKRGFFTNRFATPAARVETFAAMRHDTAWPPTALEYVLRAVVTDRALLDVAVSDNAVETERVERAELARLKAKYETL